MGAFAQTTGSPWLLRGEGTRKGTTGGSEGGREAISFSTTALARCADARERPMLELSWARTWNRKSTAIHDKSCFNVSNHLQNHCLVAYVI